MWPFQEHDGPERLHRSHDHEDVPTVTCVEPKCSLHFLKNLRDKFRENQRKYADFNQVT